MVIARKSPISYLLYRIRAKIEERLYQPSQQLRRHNYFKNQQGIFTLSELEYALRHFQVLLIPTELELLFNSFYRIDVDPAQFDWDLMVIQMYPIEEANWKHIENDADYYDKTTAEQKSKQSKPAAINTNAGTAAATADNSSSNNYIVQTPGSSRPVSVSVSTAAATESKSKSKSNSNQTKKSTKTRITTIPHMSIHSPKYTTSRSSNNNGSSATATSTATATVPHFMQSLSNSTHTKFHDKCHVWTMPIHK